MSRKQATTLSSLEHENAELRALNAALERRLADAELSVSQTNLSVLIENADGSIWSVDAHYGLILGNQIFHRNVSAPLGRRLEKGESVLLPGFSPEAIAEWKGYYDRALQGEAFSVEAKTRFREIPRYVEYRFNPLREADGSIHGVTVFGRDITERKQAENELQESERKLRELNSDLQQSQSVGHLGNWKWDLKTSSVEWSDEMFRIFGIDKDSYTGRLGDAIAKVIHPDDLHIVLPENASKFAGNKPQEYRIIWPDGSIRHIWAKAGEAILDEQGNPAYLTGIAQDITERKLLEEEVFRLARFPSENPNPVLRVALDGCLLYANTASAPLLELWNCQVGEYLPQDWREYISDGISPKLMDVTCRERVYSVTIAPVYAEGYVNLYAVDVTGRKRIEENLRTSELRFRSAAECLTDVIYEWDLGERIDWYGDVDGMMGYSRGEFPRTFSGWLNLLHPDDREMVWAAVDGQLKGAAPYNIEYRIKRKDGEWRWWSARGIALRDGSGEAFQWVGSVTDITERREAEKVLRESEEKFKYLFDYSMIGKSITLPTGEIQVNNALCDMLGYSQQELQNKRWQEITHPEDIAETEKMVASLLSGERGSGRFIKRYLHKNGDTVWTDVSTSLRRDRNGSPLYFMTSISDITERKHVEDALRESEDKFRKAFMTSPDSININRIQDGTYISVNPGFTQIMGYTEAEVIGKSSLALEVWVDPKDRDQLVEGLRKDGFVNNLEARFRRKDGGIIYGLMSAAIIELDGVPHILNISRDITARKQAENALRESEHAKTELLEKLNESQRFAMIGSWEWDLQTDRVWWSDETYVIFGVTRQGFTPGFEANSRFVHPDDLEKYNASFKHSLQTGEPLDVEIRLNANDGLLKHCLVKGKIVYNDAGVAFRFIGTILDITARKQVEKELRVKDDLLHMTSEMAKVGGWEFDALTLDGTWTDEVASIHDLDPADPTNVNLGVSFYLPDSRREIEQAIQNAIQSAIPYDLELQMVTAKGNSKWVRTMGLPFLEDGRVVKVRGIFQDITEHKKSQEQLHNTLGELQRSNAELEQFAYVASHDLQEPLRTVAGMVQLLQKRYQGQLDEQADEYINLAYDGATRMQNLISDLLVYSRVDRRNNPIQPINANEVLKSALLNLEVSIARQGATVTSDSLPTIEADATQLTLLFQNLIGNAIKFHSERPPLVHVSAEKLDDAWRFSVCDNGIGIEPQYFERIFLVFQRLHTRREYPGTGIGLSICKKIVERHGGRIWVESQPGQGTTFYFTIPHRR